MDFSFGQTATEGNGALKGPENVVRVSAVPDHIWPGFTVRAAENC